MKAVQLSGITGLDSLKVVEIDKRHQQRMKSCYR
jgi:hypothetical protein